MTEAPSLYMRIMATLRYLEGVPRLRDTMQTAVYVRLPVTELDALSTTLVQVAKALAPQSTVARPAPPRRKR